MKISAATVTKELGALVARLIRPCLKAPLSGHLRGSGHCNVVVGLACNRPDHSLSCPALRPCGDTRAHDLAAADNGDNDRWVDRLACRRSVEHCQPNCGKRVSFPQLKLRPFGHPVALHVFLCLGSMLLAVRVGIIMIDRC